MENQVERKLFNSHSSIQRMLQSVSSAALDQNSDWKSAPGHQHRSPCWKWLESKSASARNVLTEPASPSLRDLLYATALTSGSASQSVFIMSWPRSGLYCHEMYLMLSSRTRLMGPTRTSPTALEPCPFSLCTALLQEWSLASPTKILFFRKMASNVSDLAKFYNRECWK